VFVSLNATPRFKTRQVLEKQVAKMCCGKRVCMLCTCVVLVAILIGLLFGFGIYKNGFHKLKDAFHECDSSVSGSLCGAGIGRPFMGYAPPPPPF
jgi:hypothetical protein